MRKTRSALSRLAGAALAFSLVGGLSIAATTASIAPAAAAPTTRTPIEHLVVIFQENVSFDHYFGTYPNATNPAGEDQFSAASGTPSVTNLADTPGVGGTGTLLTNNPNSAQPQRLDPGQNRLGTYNSGLDSHGSNAGINHVLTCSQNHSYTPEQTAMDDGAMDKYPASVGSTAAAPEPGEPACTTALNMDYYDGNTVTAYWNYAQHYAMSDNNFGTGFGPSTPGAVNVVSGDTGNVNIAVPSESGNTGLVADGSGGFTDINDSDPYYDDCSSTSKSFGLAGQNVGDLLNAAGVSWGFFEGGFTPTSAYSGPANGASNPYNQTGVTGRAVCGASHNVGSALGGTGSAGAQPYGTTADYIPHHQPFQYYPNTANPHHIAPTSLSAIGTDTQSFSGGSYGVGTPEFNTANHQYDMSAFNSLVQAIAQGSMPASALPAISYLKAPAYEDEHPAYSDPIDGQHFVTQEINSLMQTPDWASTAVIVTFDDSDGWYDQVWSGAQNGNQPQNPSHTSADTLSASGTCGSGTTPLAGENGRCGFGPRLPLLVISPYAKANSVDHDLQDQASVVNFIEYNWQLPGISGSADRLLTDATTSFDMQSMFDFTPNASDVAGPGPYFLDPSTFQTSSQPVPDIPEAHTPAYLPLIGALVFIGAVGGLFVRRRRRSLELVN